MHRLILFILLMMPAWFADAATFPLPYGVLNLDEKGDLNKSLRNYFGCDASYEWREISIEKGLDGYRHFRYQQYYQSYPVQNAIIILHENVHQFAVNGIFTKIDIDTKQKPLTASNIVKLIPEREINITGIEIRWQEFEKIMLVAAVSVNADDLIPVTYLFDALSGRYLSEESHVCYASVPGIAETGYNGTRHISCMPTPSGYTLECDQRGLGIETLNVNSQLNYNFVTSFTDADNYWQQSPGLSTDYATDAHFCAASYYDFLLQKFGRSSLDDNGYRLKSFLNYGTSLNNAFWNGSAVVYGTSAKPLTTLDIAGHEFTHGLIQKTANLDYHDEPGTLNEAIADMLGVALEHFISPQNANWTIAEQTGTVLRSLEHPAFFQQPSAYLGPGWYYGTNDNGGVHINSGFLNHWFYTLSEGTPHDAANDITGVGIEKATAIVYQALVAYLLPGSGFNDFRTYTIQSSIDLYGSCSPEYMAVMYAWNRSGFELYTANNIKLSATSLSLTRPDSIQLTAALIPGAIYTWYWNGIPVANGSNNVFINEPGYWSVSATFCGVMLTGNELYIHENSEPALLTVMDMGNISAEIYPSPSRGKINIFIHKSLTGMATIRLYSVNGALVKSFSSGESRITIDAEEMVPGIYFIELNTGNGTIRKKIMLVD